MASEERARELVAAAQAAVDVLFRPPPIVGVRLYRLRPAKAQDGRRAWHDGEATSVYVGPPNFARRAA